MIKPKQRGKQDLKEVVLVPGEFFALKPGMTVKIFQKIKELNIKGGEKERIQFFEGMVTGRKHGKETGGTMTVRKVSDGVGVEKIFPLNLPTITKIEVRKQVKVRRAKLNFLKEGYKKRIKEVAIKINKSDKADK
jgi:large subunit ribosomal protein L19